MSVGETKEVTHVTLHMGLTRVGDRPSSDAARSKMGLLYASVRPGYPKSRSKPAGNQKKGLLGMLPRNQRVGVSAGSE
jgi:hypothetical protein